MKKLKYPDSGSPFEDAAILKNAIYFSTSQRSLSARILLQQMMSVSQQTLNFLVTKAFEEFMTSTEDLIAWYFALREWRPGSVEFSLFMLLDRIRVGSKSYPEKQAVAELLNLDADGFRGAFHIPTAEELIKAGMSNDFVDSLQRGMPFKLNGWLNIAKRRVEKDRTWVRMFNKCKHHMYAFPIRENDKNEVWMPTSIRFDKSRNRVYLGRGSFESSPERLRRFAGDAIAAQAVLHDTLAVILTTRYDEKYEPPRWILDAFGTDYIWQKLN